MNKILQLPLIVALAVFLSCGRESEPKESSAKENEFVNETLSILKSYRENSVTNSYYLEDAFEVTSTLDLPVHLLVN